MADIPRRVLPAIDGPTGFFWASGADSALRFLRCRSCGYFIHPPTPYCPECGARDALPDTVSGRAHLYSYTVNHQPWDSTEGTYIIGIVEIDEQPGLRLMTNLVGVELKDVHIGMPVEVVFENHHPVYLPLFRPVAE
jgi:uncharacterized OB-fold protein